MVKLAMGKSNYSPFKDKLTTEEAAKTYISGFIIYCTEKEEKEFLSAVNEEHIGHNCLHETSSEGSNPLCTVLTALDNIHEIDGRNEANEATNTPDEAEKAEVTRVY